MASNNQEETRLTDTGGDEEGNTTMQQLEVEDEEYEEETRKLRSLLQFFFFSAFKWKSGKCNFHLVQMLFLIVQVAKVALITSLIFSFGQDRKNFNSIVNTGANTLRHLFLKGWDATREVTSYPPSQGKFAVYDIKKLEERINHAVAAYYNAKEDAVGYFVRLPNDNMSIMMKYYTFQEFDHDSNMLDFKVEEFQPKHGLSQVMMSAEKFFRYDITQELESRNFTEQFKRILYLNLPFQLHSVRVYEEKTKARCLRVEGNIQFSDLDNNGQVTLKLDTLTHGIRCSKMNIRVSDWVLELTPVELAWAVFVLSLLSLIIAVGNAILSFYAGVKTYRYMKKYFKRFYDPPGEESDLSRAEYFRFVKLWDYCQLISDVLTLRESLFIASIVNNDEYTVAKLDPHAVCLSVGGLLAWLSILRFFKFHIKFHLLFSTLYRAAFDVLAYILCVTILFLGFWVCGYVVLSPYHVKFETPSACAETLISIVNGDEIYATLAILEDSKTGDKIIWWFTRVYIISYVGIFTIVVINLLIAIYMTAYDSIKEFNKERKMRKTTLERKPRTIKAFIEIKDNLTRTKDGEDSWRLGPCTIYHWCSINRSNTRN